MNFEQLPGFIKKVWEENPSHARVMEKLYSQLVVTTAKLEQATAEVQGWWDDQGNYGTTGYEVLVPSFKDAVKNSRNLIDKLIEED